MNHLPWETRRCWIFCTQTHTKKQICETFLHYGQHFVQQNQRCQRQKMITNNRTGAAWRDCALDPAARPPDVKAGCEVDGTSRISTAWRVKSKKLDTRGPCVSTIQCYFFFKKIVKQNAQGRSGFVRDWGKYHPDRKVQFSTKCRIFLDIFKKILFCQEVILQNLQRRSNTYIHTYIWHPFDIASCSFAKKKKKLRCKIFGKPVHSWHTLSKESRHPSRFRTSLLLKFLELSFLPCHTGSPSQA